MLKSKNEAFANHCGFDVSEVKEYRYHYGRTSQPVWALNDGYYCVTKGIQKPAVHREGMQWNWNELSDEFLNKFGYKIWKST